MKIPVFYSPHMAVDVVLSSPSPRKPHLLLQEWQEHYASYIELHDVTPLSRQDFYRVHDKKHVDFICNNERRNGFGVINKEVTQSLYYTNASFVQAAEYALTHRVAVSPTSGFHHAQYAKAHGFCTFNGLMIAADILWGKGLANKIGILDCDFHYGDGTDDIIHQLKVEDRIVHITAQTGYPYDDGQFFRQLPSILERFHECDILFYQAGADAHIDDPYGGFLTTSQLQMRDEMVFLWAKQHAKPIVWNLAGGYQEDPITHTIDKVLTIHNNTLIACHRVFCDTLKV